MVNNKIEMIHKFSFVFLRNLAPITFYTSLYMPIPLSIIVNWLFFSVESLFTYDASVSGGGVLHAFSCLWEMGDTFDCYWLGLPFLPNVFSMIIFPLNLKSSTTRLRVELGDYFSDFLSLEEGHLGTSSRIGIRGDFSD